MTTDVLPHVRPVEATPISCPAVQSGSASTPVGVGSCIHSALLAGAVWGGSVSVVLAMRPVADTEWAALWDTAQLGAPIQTIEHEQLLRLFEKTVTEVVEGQLLWTRRTISAGTRHLDLPEPELAHHALDVRDALESITAWTRMPVAQVAAMLGGSRRSYYNWLEGKLSEGVRERIVRVRELLAPLAEARDATSLRNWLTHGDPAPTDLILANLWDDLAESAQAALTPIRPLSDEESAQYEKAAGEYAYPSAIHEQALLAFSAPPATPMRRRPDWKPREMTGLSDEEDDE